MAGGIRGVLLCRALFPASAVVARRPECQAPVTRGVSGWSPNVGQAMRHLRTRLATSRSNYSPCKEQHGSDGGRDFACGLAGIASVFVKALA